jgi:hypothetical protein
MGGGVRSGARGELAIEYSMVRHASSDACKEAHSTMPGYIKFARYITDGSVCHPNK